MRFLHTSDLHLGITLCESSLLPYQQELPRILCEAAEAHRADVVIIAGDIYDNSLSNAEAIAVYNRLATDLCLVRKKTVILCAGNHDGAARLSSCSELLKECGLHIYGRIRFPVTPLRLEGCDVYVLPYFNIDEVRSGFPEREIKSYADAMNTVLDTIREGMDKTRKNLLVCHCFVTGGELSDSDTAAKIGGANAVPAGVFHSFDYVALGHLHKPQTIGENLRYCGTPMKYSFSEAAHKKSFTLFDTADGSMEEIPVPPAYDLAVLEDTYENLLTREEESAAVPRLLKLVMTDRFAGQETFSRLKERYPQMLQLQGRAVESDGISALTLQEIITLSPDELVKRFIADQTGGEISEEQLAWFNAAAEESTKGGALQ